MLSTLLLISIHNWRKNLQPRSWVWWVQVSPPPFPSSWCFVFHRWGGQHARQCIVVIGHHKPRAELEGKTTSTQKKRRDYYYPHLLCFPLALRIFQTIDGWMSSWLKSMETKPFAAGLSLLVVALLMPSSVLGWLCQCFLCFLGVFLVCSTMATNAHQATDFFGRIGLGCVEHVQLILGELPSKLQQGISGGIKGFSDKFLSW